MNLPDPWASRAVLIGSYSYRDLEPLPAVANNLQRLSELFASADLWGLPSRNCQVLPNPSGPAEVLDLIHEAATEASDALLVYYAGHGLVDPHTDDLYLALPESSLARLYSAVRFEDLRREMVSVAGASSKVVILDCCYSGRAMIGGMSGSMEMADQARIEGTYLMTASAETVKAQAPVGEEFTAFTNELVTALDHGLPDGPDLLNVETLYWHLRKELVAKRRPTPQQRAGNDGGMIVLARNRHGVRSAARSALPRQPLPEPPEGSALFMRRPPREIAAEAARLSDQDCAAEARQLLTAVAVRRPDQEVAALIAVLRDEHRASDAELVINAVTGRPADEITALLDVLWQIGSAQDADQILNAVARRTAEEVGATADALARGSRDRALRQLLDSAIAAHQRPEEIIALVGTLSSIGLGQEISRLLDLAAEGLTDAETAALADGLRGAGRDEAAFRLYAASLASIARRPPKDLASLLRAMRDADRNDDADRLLTEVCAAHYQPRDLMELTSALWSASLDDDSGRLLEAAAATMTHGQIAVLAQSLREADRYEPALRLCIEAAARQPVLATAAIVQALRDAGRPVDAHRVLDSSQAWPPEKSAELITLLSAAEGKTDADRVLKAASRGGADHFCGVVAALREQNSEEDAERLAALLALDSPADVRDLVSALLDRNMKADAESMLATAAAGSADYFCDLTEILRQGEMMGSADYLLRWQAQRDTVSVLDHLGAFRQRGRDEDATRLLGHFVSRPIEDVVRLAGELSENQAEAAILVSSLAQRTPADIISVLKVMRQSCGIDIGATLADMANGSWEGMMPFIDAMQVDLPLEIPDFIRAIGSRKEGLATGSNLSSLSSSIADLRRTGLDDSADTLLDAVVIQMRDAVLLDFHAALTAKAQHQDADRLLEAAIAARSVSFLVYIISQPGILGSLWRSQQARGTIMQIAARRSDADVATFTQALRQHGYHSEARQIRKYARRS